MNALELLSKEPTMDSRDIAGLVKKEHWHVLRDIREMLDELGIEASRFGFLYTAENNKQSTYYRLPRRECLILASGYSVKLRAAIIDRWEWLETERSRLLSDRLIEKLSEIELTFDDCKDESSPSHLRTFKQTARLLNTPGMTESALYRFCNNIGATLFWSSTPCTHFLQIGYLEGVILRETRRSVVTQTKWTKKGIAWLIVQMSLAGLFDGDRKFKDIAIERKWQ